MHGRTDPRRAIAAALALLTVITWVPITRGSSRDARRILQRLPVLSGSMLPFLADLDGDFAADSVKLSSNGFDKTIDIKFANLRTREFSFAAKSVEQGTLIAKDIDGDGDLDLIWITGRNQKTAVVLINDGKGDFTKASDNAPYAPALNALLSSSDPSNQNSLQAGHQVLSLSSSSSPDIGAGAASKFTVPTIRAECFVGFNGFGNLLAFLSYLHKRGPPLTHS